MPAPRVLVDQPLGQGARIRLDADQARYLTAVMRLRPGDAVRLFNGRDGEWSAQLTEADKRGAILEPLEQLRPMAPSPDLWLLFAPVKRQATDLIVEKATELGVARLWPVFTERTVAETVRRDRMEAITREASEQCERLDAPQVADATPLARALDGWPPERPLLFCDEAGEGAAPLLRAVAEAPGSLAVLVGPEGGFSPAERRSLIALPFVRPVSLGPRILRAETAAIAALAVVQAGWPAVHKS